MIRLNSEIFIWILKFWKTRNFLKNKKIPWIHPIHALSFRRTPRTDIVEDLNKGLDQEIIIFDTFPVYDLKISVWPTKNSNYSIIFVQNYSDNFELQFRVTVFDGNMFLSLK